MVAASDPSGELKNHDSSVEFHDSYPMTDLFFTCMVVHAHVLGGFCCFSPKPR